jgi:Sec-independent protein translocase protein TatA
VLYYKLLDKNKKIKRLSNMIATVTPIRPDIHVPGEHDPTQQLGTLLDPEASGFDTSDDLGSEVSAGKNPDWLERGTFDTEESQIDAATSAAAFSYEILQSFIEQVVTVQTLLDAFTDKMAEISDTDVALPLQREFRRALSNGGNKTVDASDGTIMDIFGQTVAAKIRANRDGTELDLDIPTVDPALLVDLRPLRATEQELRQTETVPEVPPIDTDFTAYTTRENTDVVDQISRPAPAGSLDVPEFEEGPKRRGRLSGVLGSLAGSVGETTGAFRKAYDEAVERAQEPRTPQEQAVETNTEPNEPEAGKNTLGTTTATVAPDIETRAQDPQADVDVVDSQPTDESQTSSHSIGGAFRARRQANKQRIQDERDALEAASRASVLAERR